MVLTPTQAKTLGQEYKYRPEIHCYLAVPDSNSWNFIATTEGDLWQMIFRNAMDANSAKLSDETAARLEIAKTLKLCLWKGPGSFRIDTIDPEAPTMCIFPFVYIEEINDQDVLGKFAPLEKKFFLATEEQLTPTIEEIQRSLDYLVQRLKQDPFLQSLEDLQRFTVPDFSSELMTRFKQMIRIYTPNLTTDPAAFWGSVEMSAGFELSKKVPTSSFQVLAAEKLGNVFYMHVQYVFPASDTSYSIYWDQEFVAISTGKKTLFVQTSAPGSLAQRFTEGPWISGWLAGLKVPLEQQ